MDHKKIKLYKPEKYKVVIGNANSTVALCTCWNDPFTLAEKNVKLTEQFAIIGSLYSREGVSVLFRNLALNPHIKNIIIWGQGKLSQTAIGEKGKSILKNLWNNGLEMNVSYLSEIQKEIDPVVLSKILRNIFIVDMSQHSLDTVTAFAKEKNEETLSEYYMEPVSFKDPVIKSGETMPSELSNFLVRGKTVLESWIKALDRVYRYGYEKNTQYGVKQKELMSVSWTIESNNTDELLKFEAPERLKNRVGIDEAVLRQYSNIFLDKNKPQDVAYTYGNRLRSYKNSLDQIEEIINKIRTEPITRRAFAITFDPIEDNKNTSPPCLSSIQVLIGGDNKLHLIAYFRSHDMFKAALPNAYGLLNLQKHIASHTGFKPKTLTIHSTSAHIYEDDWEDANDFLSCGYWERLKLYFDEHEDIDPRGIVRIELQNNKIVAGIYNFLGVLIFECSGQTAREVGLRFARLNLLSKSEHYVDISIELTKAELSLKLNKKYDQDKPLFIDKIFIK